MIQDTELRFIVYGKYTYDQEQWDILTCLEKPIYIEYETKYSELDSAKLVFVASDHNSEYLKKDNLIWIENDICMNIETVEMSSEHTITVWGTLCDSLVSKRVLFEEISFENATVSTVFSSIFQAITPDITGLTFQTYNMPEGVTYTGTIPPGNVLDIIQDLCKKFDLGFSCRKGASVEYLELEFTVYSGNDVSSTVIMSPAYNTITDFNYKLDLSDEINFVRVTGQNSLYADVIKTGSIIAERAQGILDCSYLEQGEMSEYEYKNELTKKGQEYFSEHDAKESYSGSYYESATTAFIYGEDFSLGDLVTVRDDGLTFNTIRRVSAFRKQIDSSGSYKTLSFGDYQKDLKNVVSTLNKKVEKAKPAATSGTTVKPFEPIVSPTAPILLKAGDFFVKTASGDLTTVTQLQKLNNSGQWEDIINYTYGASPPSPASEHTGDYYVIVQQGQPRVILKSENNNWIALAYESGSSTTSTYVFILNTMPANTAKNGDVWVRIDNTTNKQASEWYKAISNNWVLQFKFGGSGVTIENAILVDAESVV